MATLPEKQSIELRKHNEEQIGKLEERINKNLEEKLATINGNLQGQINQINVELQEQSKKWEGKLGEFRRRMRAG